MARKSLGFEIRLTNGSIGMLRPDRFCRKPVNIDAGTLTANDASTVPMRDAPPDRQATAVDADRAKCLSHLALRPAGVDGRSAADSITSSCPTPPFTCEGDWTGAHPVRHGSCPDRFQPVFSAARSGSADPFRPWPLSGRDADCADCPACSPFRSGHWRRRSRLRTWNWHSPAAAGEEATPWS